MSWYRILIKRAIHVIICLSYLLAGSLHIYSQDSISAGTTLNEVVITGKNTWIDGDRVIHIPTVKEKRLSNSPQTLIKAMHLPELRLINDEVVDILGNPVTYFINGEPADEIEISTFWPMEVRRVEYIQNPSSPNFRGMQNIVNFIVSKYEYGGVSKLNLFQRIPNNGVYQLSSKSVYKRMTFGALFIGRYLKNHRDENYGEEILNDIYYDKSYYEQLSRKISEKSENCDNGMGISVNARYSFDKINLLHTASLGWDILPHEGSNCIDVWSPNLFKSNMSVSNRKSHTLAPRISGKYYFSLADRWSLGVDWNFSYTHNEYNSQVNYAEDIFIGNRIEEDVNSMGVSVQPSFFLNKNWIFFVSLESQALLFSTHYFGTTSAVAKQNKENLKATITAMWSPSKNIGINCGGGISSSLWKVDDVNHTIFKPWIKANVRLSLKNKFHLRLSSGISLSTPSAMETNKVVIQSTPILWLSGNPMLEATTNWDNYLSLSYYSNTWLCAMVGIGYWKKFGGIIPMYTPAPIHMGGMIMANENAKPMEYVRSTLNLIFDPLPSLSISVVPAFYYFHTRSPYKQSLSFFTISGSVEYTLGNFEIGLDYEGPYKDIDDAGMKRYERPYGLNASIKYGNGNVLLSLKCVDIFHNKK